MRPLARFALSGLAAWAVAFGGAAGARGQSSLGAGVVAPTGSLEDSFERGITVRGQKVLSLAPLALHLQGGWSRFEAEDGGEDADLFHAGLGVRLPLGVLWIGATGAYFSGHGEDGMGVLPEVGLGLGPFEVVADARVDGDERWGALRVALRF